MADYIDRNEAIAALTEFRDDQTVSKYVSVENCMVARGAIERATKVLESLPAHDVEPVQEWISVKDGLPEIPEGLEESPEPVLYMMKNTKTIYAGYYGEGGVWKDKYFRQYADSRNGVDADDVLCWMYQHDLPHPPKGE